MDRRTRLDDVRGELEQQTFNLFPERWQAVYLGVHGDSEDEDGEVVNNTADLDAYFDTVDDTRMISGEDVSRILCDEDGWF